jgi:hypothetical protein
VVSIAQVDAAYHCPFSLSHTHIPEPHKEREGQQCVETNRCRLEPVPFLHFKRSSTLDQSINQSAMIYQRQCVSPCARVCVWLEIRYCCRRIAIIHVGYDQRSPARRSSMNMNGQLEDPHRESGRTSRQQGTGMDRRDLATTHIVNHLLGSRKLKDTLMRISACSHVLFKQISMSNKAPRNFCSSVQSLKSEWRMRSQNAKIRIVAITRNVTRIVSSSSTKLTLYVVIYA